MEVECADVGRYSVDSNAMKPAIIRDISWRTTLDEFNARLRFVPENRLDNTTSQVHQTPHEIGTVEWSTNSAVDCVAVE